MEYTPSPEATPKAIWKAENADTYFPAPPDDEGKDDGLDDHSDMIGVIDGSPRRTSRSSLSLFPEKESGIPATIIRGGRSVTAPPLTAATPSPSECTETASSNGRSVSIKSTSSDCSSSINSFHTVQSWHSPVIPLPPSPPESNPGSPRSYPYPHENIPLPRRPHGDRETSEVTVTPGSPRVWEMTRSSSETSIEHLYQECSTPTPKTPASVDDFEGNLDEDHFAIASPQSVPRPIRRRAATGTSNAQRRESSPPPAAASLFSPSRRRPRHLQTARHLPTAIIQKTCEILLSPPSHLVQLMLDIAHKIAAGEWRGMIFGSADCHADPVRQWDYEDGDYIFDEWEEDDFGNSLGGRQESQVKPGQDGVGRSWEID